MSRVRKSVTRRINSARWVGRAIALEVDEAFFDDKIDRSIGTMRLNYYPAQAVPPVPGQLRAGAHTDYGGFTILSGEDVPGGLQVRTREDRSIDVLTTPTRFVVNIGDLLMRWTNDRWLSYMHRVVNPPLVDTPSRPRLSAAFFNHPNYDVLIECLSFQGAAQHAPVLSGEYRDLKYAKTGLRAPAGIPDGHQHSDTRPRHGPRGAGRRLQQHRRRRVTETRSYDLEPIHLCYLNEKLGPDPAEAARNSPILHLPSRAGRLVVAVGLGELPELIRQSEE